MRVIEWFGDRVVVVVLMLCVGGWAIEFDVKSTESTQQAVTRPLKQCMRRREGLCTGGRVGSEVAETIVAKKFRTTVGNKQNIETKIKTTNKANKQKHTEAQTH